MAKKHKSDRPTSNSAKARRVEKHQVERKEDLKTGGSELSTALKKFTEGVKRAVEKRQAEQIFKSFSVPSVEDAAVHTFSIPTSLTKPETQLKRSDRIQWFWPQVNAISVIATQIMTDSPCVYEEDQRHGDQAGDWVVDVIGRDGGALFRMTAETARAVAEYALSAVYWEHAWREYVETYPVPQDDPRSTASEGRLSAEVIPIYDKS